MDLNFIIKASGIIFRESLEAVLIYGIVVSFFQRTNSAAKEVRVAKAGLISSVVAAIVLGLSFAGVTPLISEQLFSYIEIVIIFGGSLMMLYMVFWMAEHSKNLKKDLETDLSRAVGFSSLSSIFGTVFVAVFREGVETVVYLYSLSLEKSGLVHRSSIALSLVIGFSLALFIYFIMVKGSKFLSMKIVFRATSLWLLFSSSALLANGLDKLFAMGLLERLSRPIFALNPPELLTFASNAMESLLGLRMQPSILHLVLFLGFWIFVTYKNPLSIRKT